MFNNTWLLQRACEVQVASDASGKPTIAIAEVIAEKSEALLKVQRAGAATGDLEFKAMQRKIDRIDDSYRD